MDRPGLSDAQPAVSLPYDNPELPTLLKYARGTRCLVVGSYTGAHMHFLLTHGAQFVHGVEPQYWAYVESRETLLVHPKGTYCVQHCVLVPWEVSVQYDTSIMYAAGHGTSHAAFLHIPRFLTKSDESDESEPLDESFNQQIQRTTEPAENVGRWIATLNPPVFDLAVLDCAGAEYGLLPYLEPICSHIVVKFNGYNNVPVPVESFYFHSTCEDLGKGWYLYT